MKINNSVTLLLCCLACSLTCIGICKAGVSQALVFQHENMFLRVCAAKFALSKKADSVINKSPEKKQRATKGNHVHCAVLPRLIV